MDQIAILENIAAEMERGERHLYGICDVCNAQAWLYADESYTLAVCYDGCGNPAPLPGK